VGVIAALALPGASSAATIKVTTTADELDASPDSTCSLREAVEAARTNLAKGGCKAGEAATDIIELAKADYHLTIPTTNEVVNANGDLDVSGGGPVVLAGESMNGTDVISAQDDRLIEVGSTAKLTLRSLTLSGGDVTSFGTGTGRGGTVEAGDGGTLKLSRVRVTSGEAYVGGGLYLAGPGTLTLSRSVFAANHATGLGGALDVVGAVETKIKRSTFSENTVTDLNDSANGGGISNRGTSMTITDSSIVDNHATGDTMEAASGGGLENANASELTIRRSLIAGNSAAAPTTNFFEGGGGIWTGAGTADVTLTNTTFYDNSAGSPNGLGGAIYAHSGTVLVNHVTFNANTAGNAGDDVDTVSADAYVLLRNSILDGGDPCSGSATFIDSGKYNLAQVDDPECDFQAGDQADVVTFGFTSGGVPTANGGPTDTIALKKSSPAVNLVPKSACGIAQKEDQRGFKRPGRGSRRCDSGAYERRARPR